VSGEERASIVAHPCHEVERLHEEFKTPSFYFAAGAMGHIGVHEKSA
jgi:hypothetical protein